MAQVHVNASNKEDFILVHGILVPFTHWIPWNKKIVFLPSNFFITLYHMIRLIGWLVDSVTQRIPPEWFFCPRPNYEDNWLIVKNWSTIVFSGIPLNSMEYCLLDFTIYYISVDVHWAPLNSMEYIHWYPLWSIECKLWHWNFTN